MSCGLILLLFWVGLTRKQDKLGWFLKEKQYIFVNSEMSI